MSAVSPFGKARHRCAAPHHQGPAAVAEVAGIARVRRDLPPVGQANAVGMHQAAEAFSIRAPAQVGCGVDGALGGLAPGTLNDNQQNSCSAT